MASSVFKIKIDTASSPWVKQDGKRTTIAGTTQTIMMYCVDLGSTGIWRGEGPSSENILSLADGSKISFNSRASMVHTGVLTDATAKPNAGSFWVSENGGKEVEVKIVTMTTADADVNNGSSGTVSNGLTTITFEYPGKPWRWTWVNADLVVA